MLLNKLAIYIFIIYSILVNFVLANPGSSGGYDHEVDNGDFWCVEGSTDC